MVNPYPKTNVISDLQIDRLRKVMDLLRVFDEQIPAQVFCTFFYVASHEGCTSSDLCRDLGLKPSSASRCTDWLSDYHRLGKPGMGLIVKTKDPFDQRNKLLKLTPKGKLIVQQIKELL
jgi:DNA-binding MarR family transcriptional regulator